MCNQQQAAQIACSSCVSYNTHGAMRGSFRATGELSVMLIHSSLLSIALLIVIAIFFVVVAVALMTVKVQVTLNVVDLLLIRIGNWLNVRRDQSWWKLR